MLAKKQLKSILLISAFALLCQSQANAQITQSSYYLNSVETRYMLNPALTPNRGYIKIPLINANVEAYSNALNIEGIGDVIENSSSASYFTEDNFMNRLKTHNQVNLNFTNDIISFGWFKGKGFWNANVSLKLDLGANIPQSIFKFLRDARGFNELDWTNYSSNVSNLKLNLNSYLETGVGYSHPINDKLTIGGRVKLLWGIANANVNVNKISVNTKVTGISPNQDWSRLNHEGIANMRGNASIQTNASLEASMKGFVMKDNEDGYVSDVRRENNFGIAGMGFGVDLGAEYKITPNITVSVAVLDLGFISWNKNSNHFAKANNEKEYKFSGDEDFEEAKDFVDLMSSGEIINTDILNVKQEKSKSRSTSLYSTILVGGEYRLLNDKLSLGLLYTARFTKPQTLSKITISSAYNLTRNVGFSLAYNYSKIAGSGLGIGIKAGPLTLSTDYTYFGENSKSVSAMISFAAPLGKKKDF